MGAGALKVHLSGKDRTIERVGGLVGNAKHTHTNTSTMEERASEQRREREWWLKENFVRWKSMFC